MAFQVGDRVEVRGTCEDLKGSWYGGEREVPWGLIRPIPQVVIVELKIGDIVDAWHERRWWTGRIDHEVDNLYMVKMEGTHQYQFFERNKLQFHQECTHGNPTRSAFVKG
ncbi:hypothetical protein L2E82_04430 [Cichorium intybus]|uniref:Uncharacterized protein n=1 Tax=Cichorium intybus TaxID=13427 RepID=A0ACB9H699_CICIN|nr:hypothetical protein L2E82_04430 [Cichorium intybus]